ncbi:hypothetical protein ACWFMI_04850 [Nocardiopsis terrae]
MAEQSGTGASGVGRGLAVGAVFLGASVLLGALLGPLWWWLAPRPEVVVLDGGGVFTGASEDVFAGEGYFVLITAAAGLATGYGAYMAQFSLARKRFQDLRLTVLITGFLGSAAASLLVWRIGTALDAPAREAVLAADPGDTVTAALQLQATAFLVVWPFVYVLQYGLLDALSLMRGDQPGVPEPVRSQGEDGIGGAGGRTGDDLAGPDRGPDASGPRTQDPYPQGPLGTTAAPSAGAEEPSVTAEGDTPGPEAQRG